ncbi:hypothetical protein PMI29_05754 [Pseudomonas sp. GM49]|uniref:hypothetical protein n=1 Tax=Pseudomonas sp. GM49 TaxID=1144331 RepID=UPI0002701FBA|nr:hypothetical protein [Pseudomonas sp. GM49]EJM53566.1 hypothetical protein PMI29_05754 [Pseudomonas sp. GM49]
MIQKKEEVSSAKAEQAPSLFSAKSGLMVNELDDVWEILPNNWKGARVSVEWVHKSEMSDKEKRLILDVFTYYVRTKAASTASGVISNVRPFMLGGIPTLNKIKAIWSGLKVNMKKALNQFFGTLSKMGNQQFNEVHKFTRTHLDKNKFNALDSSTGAFNDIEFDSLAKLINENLQRFNWAVERDFSFYQSSMHYGVLKNLVTNKLLISIVRRPIQIALMKWSDLIPSGSSFHDAAIRSVDEIGNLGGGTLQLRVFIAKSTGMLFSRECPERYPLYISEELSDALIKFKSIVFEGLELLMKSSGIQVDKAELLSLMNDIPMFPDVSMFSIKGESLDFFKSLFSSRSTAYHVSESTITNAMRNIRPNSDRVVDCIASSNRVRHTVLTRGAQDGLSAAQLAKITGVTEPAARHYIDLDYESRREIDSKYIGNEFLRNLFSTVLIVKRETDEAIVDHNFKPIGGPRNERVCDTCSTVMGRPLGCYGCPNFLPMLEADHRSVLEAAEDKLMVNRNALLNPLYIRSIEKLERQIVWIKLTIAVCDETLARKLSRDD